MRLACLGGAYLILAAATWLIFTYRHRTTLTVSSTLGGPPQTTHVLGSTLYQENPGPVVWILIGMVLALLIGSASLLWRLKRRSAVAGVAGYVAAGIAAVVAALGWMSIGILFVPLAVLLVLISMPLDKIPVV